MTEFSLNHGSPNAAKRFKALDDFTQGYIEAMFFTSTGSPDDEGLENATLADLSDDAWTAIEHDCAAFLASLPKDHHDRTWIDLACDYAPHHYDETYAGHDFWYTRNGHGVGFWNRGLTPIGDYLTTAAKAFRETNLYLGDDGLLYLE